MCLYVLANPAIRGEMGVKLNLKGFSGCPRAGVSPGLTVRVIGTAIWGSAVLLSQPGKSKAVRCRWIVADDIRDNFELLGMLIDAGIRRLTNAFFNLIRRVHPLHLGSTSCLHRSHQAL